VHRAVARMPDHLLVPSFEVDFACSRGENISITLSAPISIFPAFGPRSALSNWSAAQPTTSSRVCSFASSDVFSAAGNCSTVAL
jgi:hypothetical protein